MSLAKNCFYSDGVFGLIAGLIAFKGCMFCFHRLKPHWTAANICGTAVLRSCTYRYERCRGEAK